MSLQRRWKDLDRETVASAPDRYGVFELGDADGNSLGYGVGVLADDLKDVLAYGDVPNPSPESDASGRPERVRWVVAESPAHAEGIADERF